MTLKEANIRQFIDDDLELQELFTSRERSLDSAEKVLREITEGILDVSAGARAKLEAFLQGNGTGLDELKGVVGQSLDEKMATLGPKKPIGYLKLDSIAQLGITVDEITSAAQKKGISIKHFPAAVCLYHAEALKYLLFKHKDLLFNEGWPLDPDEFVEACNVRSVEDLQKKPIFNLITYAFGDMENSSRLSWDSMVDPLLERDLEEADIDTFIHAYNFQHVRRGTYNSPIFNAYLYIKNDFDADSLSAVEKKLEILRLLTEKGILYPGVKWHYFKGAKGGYQIFAISKNLIEARDISKKSGWQPMLTNQIIAAQLRRKITQAEYLNNVFLREDSHITAWFRRLEPDYDPQKGPQTPEGKLLNVFEASHADNWAWDPVTGVLYPIDMEVVRIEEVS